jgi:diguanylate cyclase (GGDEF)-like protein/PAS domain S-box-containing protein
MNDSAPSSFEDHEALLHFLYMAPVGLVQTSDSGRILMINPIAAQLLMPLSRDGALDDLPALLEDVAPDLRALIQGFTQAHGMICNGLRIQLRAGARAAKDPQMLSLTLLKISDTRLMAVLADVTEQVKRERLLKQNEAWLNAILTGATDYALVSLDENGCIDQWNGSIGTVTGFDRDACVGQSYALFYPEGGTTPDRVLDQLREADESGWSLDDGWRIKADGSRFWCNAMLAPVRTPADAPQTERLGYCLVIRDITDKRVTSENLLRSASQDHLTGIANRRSFFEAAEVELARWRRSPRPLTLILFDADHFKTVNDTYGHPAGDLVLCHMADALTSAFRACDIVARIGGEEFAVLVPSVSAAHAQKVANDCLLRIAARCVDIGAETIRYTVSGGIACMEAGIEDLDALMKRADEALYAAKAAGRNRIAQWSGA